MPFRRRRPVARAAVVGGTAYAAGKAGAKAGAAQAQQQEAAGQTPSQAAPAPAAAETSDEKFAQLENLKGLLDNGVLTQEEFEQQKQRILDTL